MPAHVSVPSISIQGPSSPGPSPASDGAARYPTRPTSSRQHSHSSIRSTGSTGSRRIHRQQQEYVPSAVGVSVFTGTEVTGPIGLEERWQFEQAEEEEERRQHEREHSHHHHHDYQDYAEEEDDSHLHVTTANPDAGSNNGDEYDHSEADDTEWETMRDGSISRRPAWRRPSPAWIYPFMVAASLSLGMGMAPRSELYINLACLGHPPQQPRGTQAHLASFGVLAQTPSFGIRDAVARVNTTVPEAPTVSPMPSDTYYPSPADKWFLKIQHEIYDYEMSHRKSVNKGDGHGSGNGNGNSNSNGTHSHSAIPSSARPTPTALPSGPIPHPSDQNPTQTSYPSPAKSKSPKDKTSSGTRIPFHEIDPRLCKKDPIVQAAAAKLTMIITLTTGILSALTTGYWGQTSDRIGRGKVMGIVVVGLCLNEICFVLVATFPYLAPGGYNALLIGPTIDGLLGGFSTISATINAYISDTTPDGSRATVFARTGGIMMAGFACGPVLGALLIRATGDILFPFYINIAVLAFFALLIFFILPESLSTQARQYLAKNAVLAKESGKRRDALEREWENQTPGYEADDPLLDQSGWSRISGAGAGAGGAFRSSKLRKRLSGRIRRGIRKLFAFLQPIAIFGPQEREDGSKDWNMTLVGAGMFIMGMAYGILQVKTQYAMFAYGWTSSQLGPFMSLVAFTRSFVLLIAIPILMRFIKPLFAAPPEPAIVQDSDFSSSTIPSSPVDEPLVKAKSKRPALLDLYMIRISICFEITAYILIASGRSEMGFVLCSMLATLGGAANPTANSLALSLLPSSREAGRLFGGLAVLHAIGGSLFSPIMFGTVFAATVGKYAPTVFILVSALLLLALFFFLCVRLNTKEKDIEARGRSRRVKTVRSSSGLQRVS